MRVMVAAIAGLIVCIPARGLADGTTSVATAASSTAATPPPATLPLDEPLGGGKDVSRPLTPVELPDLRPAGDLAPDPDAVQRVENVQDQQYARRGPLGPGWDDLEFLLWWPKAQGLPPLVTGSRSGAPPVLGNPGTAVLLGGHMLENQDIAGGRFTLGVAVNEEQTIGVEGVYFFLGSRTLKTTIGSAGNPAADSLGLPFHNALTNQQDVFVLAAPGVSAGTVFVSSTTRIQGAEGNFVASLYDGINVKLNGLIGYRFLQVNEGLAIVDSSHLLSGASPYGAIYDGFDGHNNFNGGQVGLHADMSHGIVFCELTGKVAIGVTSETLHIDGATAVSSPGAQIVPGGVYALPSNMGTYNRGAFAVAPEGTCKVGLKLGDVTRLFVGYDFLYLSALVRPADQIDRSINPIEVPSLSPGAGFTGPDRPRVPFARSDFWTQGLTIGLETRY